MSQLQDSKESKEPLSSLTADQDFDAGFTLPEEKEKKPEQSPAQPLQDVPRAKIMEQVSPVPSSGTPFTEPPPEPSATSSTPTKHIEIPDSLQDELTALHQMSAEAAALAREDSPEGEMMRHRLGRYGADSALDRAELILNRREKERLQQRSVEACNQHFLSVLNKHHAEFSDSVKRPALVNGVKSWIESKPYKEATSLMGIFTSGQNPYEIAAMVTRYKQEQTQSGARAPDPEKAFAVLRRGPSLAPRGREDKDDFDAGFNLKL